MKQEFCFISIFVLLLAVYFTAKFCIEFVCNTFFFSLKYSIFKMQKKFNVNIWFFSYKKVNAEMLWQTDVVHRFKHNSH